MPCRLCERPTLLPVTVQNRGQERFHLVRCPACGLFQTADERDAFSGYRHLAETAIDQSHIWCQGDHKLPAFRQWLGVTRRHLRPCRGALLDVGCGTGGFLEFARDAGFEPYGFDLSPAQVKVAAARFRRVAVADSPRGYAEQLGNEMRFDVITLWDVLEHIRRPNQFLGQLPPLLAPGGVLYVSVPCGGAIPWKLLLGRLRRRPPELIPWEHVSYFTPRALTTGLVANGLDVLELGTVACYPRPLSPFEALRRLGFTALRWLPRWAPQIYAVARGRQA